MTLQKQFEKEEKITIVNNEWTMNDLIGDYIISKTDYYYRYSTWLKSRLEKAEAVIIKIKKADYQSPNYGIFGDKVIRMINEYLADKGE